MDSLRARIFRRSGLAPELALRSGSIVLAGRAASWDQKVAAGWAAAAQGYRGVVNRLSVDGIAEERLPPSTVHDRSLAGRFFDVAIIGGGVVGCALARELSKHQLSVVILEKDYDVAVHTSSRNDGMIHDGFAAKPGTKKAHYNVRGNRLWEPICRDLGLDFHRPGSLIVFRSAFSRLVYPIMAARARDNQVDGWEYWSPARVRAEEPNICSDQHGGFFLPSAAVLSPYKATVALAENAVRNGVELALNCCVEGFGLEAGHIATLRTNRGEFRAGAVVNAAGNWADVVAELAGDGFFSLHQRRGSELILDSNTAATQRHILGMPSLLQVKSKTKGGGLVTTVEGNILVGPTARESPGREDYATSADEIHELEKHLRINRRLSLSQVITYFSGVRPCSYDEDFIVERSVAVANLIHAAGIQSPGLASAPAIAEDLAAMALAVVAGYKEVIPKAGWEGRQRGIPELKRLPRPERAALIAAHPAYGRIVCRCEEVSEGEIRDALRGPLPVDSVDAVKRRTRAGMGRCHGGFCTPRVMQIIADEKQVAMTAVTRKGPGSELCPLASKAGRDTLPRQGGRP
ncbi:MAG: hypothetical protein A2087_00430 [Spirochaetes bacterium GWD1_61_31]|nr:MAG: hypothetical protein A2Y37_00395 [Spirochaetes bacterium GWB1_60_80]OHD28943.1 MAG: hypothetical protein A2004_10875 [Spirochaetes bacterium GWC1_61_12]OHD39128.1 MAG: hypothetical protein A2087_00430 [Spirochaetes bacterium GWD1_61_31]OHD43572.1 MAG: hypothetical protein A2Y35_04665 [Spirochaetes bacterium GWE1_60_18]OHD59038.1 MAG: hypothetical protein A2Y32_01860 [Spirochaetes bacterium GWF1_60_12]